MKKDFLPIGTVVLLKNATKKIMITGYLPKTKGKPDEIFDYSACLFPEGIVSSNQTAVFNTDQIAEIIQTGYSNDETEKFVAALNQIVNDDSIASDETPAEQPAEEMPVEPVPVVSDQPLETPAEETPAEETTPEENETLEMPITSSVEPESAPEPELEDHKIEDTPVESAHAEVAPAAEATPAEGITEEASPSAPLVTFDNNTPVGVDSIKPFSE